MSTPIECKYSIEGNGPPLFLIHGIGATRDAWRFIVPKIKSNFTKKKKFTRFIKGKLTFSKKGFAEFEVLKGQESYKIKSFTKSNAWGVFREGISKFKKGSYIQCYSSSDLNKFLIS